MHAVLLAAGMGRRLQQITGGGPKCLLPFDGASLLERHLRCLARAGVTRTTIVVGHESMQIEQALAAIVPDAAPEMTLDTVHNPAFREGSAASVVAAGEALSGDDDVLLMDADVLYDDRLLSVFVEPREGAANRLAMDCSVTADDAEAVKVALSGERIAAFDKTLPAGLDYDTLGESVGFFRLDPALAGQLISRCRTLHEADPETPYEAALQQLMTDREASFTACDITGLPWIEIDYPDDVTRAENEIAPRLQAQAG